MTWYPQNKKELDKILEEFLISELKVKEIHGLIVPHAGYSFSGKIAGKAFSLIKKKIDKAVILGPSHYVGFHGIKSVGEIETPFGKVKVIKNDFPELNNEHSVENQIPFLQKLNSQAEILPLVVGEISESEAKEIAEKITDMNAVYIFSTDLSHFLPYEQAIKKDKKTIEIIEKLDLSKWNEIDACGIFPLLIMMNLCKLKNWKPHLVEYKNSGDVTGDKTQVVGYASFWF